MKRGYDEIVREFHIFAYNMATEGRSWGGATYMGHKLWKWPCDLQLYAEVIWEVKPHVIVETGTAFGGSALYYAHLLDNIGWGKVVSVDLNPVQHSYPKHPRIAYVGGKSSTSAEALAEVRGFVNAWCEPKSSKGRCMVILDSDHAKGHVLAELNAYAGFVSPASYLVVEDTNVNGHPVYLEHGPGPQEALDAWLPKHPDFKVDEGRASKYLLSFHTWLRRTRA
jgi:cephalosporin hydroxylase